MNSELHPRERILITSSRPFQFQGYHATGLTEILKGKDKLKVSR